MNPAVVLLSAVTAERLAELWWARRNTAALLAQGAHEFAPGHYPAIVLLHALWLAGLWIFGWDAAAQSGLARRLSRLAGLAALDSGDARSALDDAHHRSAGRAAGRRAAPIGFCRIRTISS